MVAAFGSSPPRKWANRQFLENHPRIRVGGLGGRSEVILSYGGKTQIVQIEEEWTFGRRQRLRPWFRCPDCNRRCRLLHEKDGSFKCRLCTGNDYRSRHYNGSCPSLNRLRGGRLAPQARARERIIAQVEIARLLRDTLSDLERRAKRGKRR